jgi:transcriptional regulator with XRE-family HTH domain
MYQLHGGQIKAARALLNWRREDLADMTGLSPSTIRNLELGYKAPRGKTITIIRQAVEDAGVEFTEDEGVRRKKGGDIIIIEGPYSCDMLFEDMLQTVKAKRGEVVGIFKSQDMMAKSLGVDGMVNMDRLKNLNGAAAVKCLFSDTSGAQAVPDEFQFRLVPGNSVMPMHYFVYDGKFAEVFPDGKDSFHFILHKSFGLAKAFRDYFGIIWNMAAPLA